ncbi:MAG TPA: hypothetical protein VKS78_16920 [Roseiarcus sp.]|nr:hypothetical protein [Roseiarcus sp.]
MSAPIAAPRRRRAWRSLLGAALAALYAAAFVAAYIDYLDNAGTWLADLPLLLLAIPFTLMMDFLTLGWFSMSGDETAKVIIAALFCCALAYLIGTIVELAARAFWRVATARQS